MTVVEHEVLAPAEILTDAERRARMLEAAALEIEARGWAQGSSCTAEGRTCLMGAIAFAHGLNPSREGGLPEESFTPVCTTWGAFGQGSPIDWNDRHARSAEEVTMILRWRADEVRRGVA